MKKNEVKAEMDIAKMGAQSFIAMFFALVIQAITGKILSLEVFIAASIATLAGILFFVRKFKYLARELDKIERELK